MSKHETDSQWVHRHRLPLAQRAHLHAIDPADTGGWEKSAAVARTKANIDALRDLQYRLFVEDRQSLLVILQAADAAGKDGVIRKVLGKMNPQGCRVYGFKKPTSQEIEHDFLWRVHACTPAAGETAIFNRSHYEDVLVARVEELVPKETWQRRYEHINAFERLLNDRGTRIAKFYLHISQEEQLERFQARLDDPTKHWKLNEGDYHSRDRWPAYERAFDDALTLCNAEQAPWYIVPANKKWYRDLVVSEVVRHTLEQMNPQLPPISTDIERIRDLLKRELAELKAAQPEQR
jgi:PPK2 family polyphosphate:nucleotide phosphotransferase